MSAAKAMFVHPARATAAKVWAARFDDVLAQMTQLRAQLETSDVVLTRDELERYREEAERFDQLLSEFERHVATPPASSSAPPACDGGTACTKFVHDGRCARGAWIAQRSVGGSR